MVEIPTDSWLIDCSYEMRLWCLLFSILMFTTLNLYPISMIKLWCNWSSSNIECNVPKDKYIEFEEGITLLHF